MADQPAGHGLWAVWRGSGTDESLRYSYFSDGYWQPSPRLLPAAEVPGSACTPALAPFGGTLLLAYRGARINRQIWITSSADGATWTPQRAAGATLMTDVAPAMIVAHGVDGRLWLAWHGSGDSAWWSSSGDGTHWAPGQPVTSPAPEVASPATTATPALAAWDGIVYMAGTGTDGRVWWTSNSDGTGSGWAPPGCLDTVDGQPVRSNAAPALAAFGGTLCLAWQYPTGDIAMISYDGEWGNFRQVEPPDTDVGPGSLSSPSLGVVRDPDDAGDDRLYLAWGSLTGGLYYASTPDGKTWGYGSIPGGPGPGQPQPPALLGI